MIDPATCNCPFKSTCTRDIRYVVACEGGRGPKHLTSLALHKYRHPEEYAKKKIANSNSCKEERKKSMPSVFRLGDNIGNALKAVGITDERVTKWLGRPCGCPERRARLNILGAWAHRVLTGNTDSAKEYLEEILEDS